MDSFDEALQKIFTEARKMALNGKYGFTPAESLAIQNLSKCHFNATRAINKLIKTEVYKCTLNGGLTSLGGFTTSIAGFPANIITVLAMQLRIVYAVAYIRNYEIYNNDSLDVIAKVCLLSNDLKSLLRYLKEIGFKNYGKVVPLETLKQINDKIFKQLTTKIIFKTGGKVLEFIPLVGGVVGAIIDYNLSHNVGNSVSAFFNKDNEDLADYFLN